MSKPLLGPSGSLQAHLVLESACSPGSSCIGQDSYKLSSKNFAILPLKRLSQKMKKCRLIAALSCLFYAPPQSVLLAQHADADPLRGLPPKLGVVIEGLGSDALRAGLDASQLRTDLELKLRLAGISVVTATGNPYIYLNVNCLETKGGYACAISVSLHELVSLIQRTVPDSFLAVIWKRDNILTTNRSGASEYIRQSVKDRVDDFLNSYLFMNPRR